MELVTGTHTWAFPKQFAKHFIYFTYKPKLVNKNEWKRILRCDAQSWVPDMMLSPYSTPFNEGMVQAKAFLKACRRVPSFFKECMDFVMLIEYYTECAYIEALWLQPWFVQSFTWISMWIFSSGSSNVVRHKEVKSALWESKNAQITL